jgi:8-oxo-dGTP diphosphatase
LTGEEILAGGGVVWRRVAEGFVVVLIHRPAYDDWSLPKGKVEGDESVEQAALREVEEETGLRCQLGGEVVSARYRDRHGRPKTVRYWAMRPIGGELAPSHEVDAAVWKELSAARTALTYPHDRAVLDSFAAVAATREA